MKCYTKKLFLFESINLKIPKIHVCYLIIMYAFGNPLKYGIGYFSIIFKIFLEKKIDKIKKNKKIMDQIQGENIGRGGKEEFFL